MSSHNEANQIVTPTTEELQALFNLESGPEPAPRKRADPQPETLADPEAWVKDFLSDLESPQIDTIDTDGTLLNPGQREWAIREKQRQMLTAALAFAIRALRKKLGLSQWEMHFKVGGRSTLLGNWENGRSVPSGVAILMLLRLCPDAETLANFGLSFPLKG
jgi:DNA-binding transcriptional regulator YiaG